MTLIETPAMTPDTTTRCSTRTCKKRRSCQRYRCHPRGELVDSICLDFGDNCTSYLHGNMHSVKLIDARDSQVDQGIVQ